MQKTLRHGLVWFLTLNLLASTMGLTVHSLYCLCKDSLAISVFEPEFHCGQPINENLPSCCKKTLEESFCQKDHGCEKKDAKYVKLDVDFVLEKTDSELQFSDFQELVVVFAAPEKTIVINLGGEYYNKPPPPKPFGKTLLPFFQAFLC